MWRLFFVVYCVVASFPSETSAAAGESIVLDPVSGDYVLTYRSTGVGQPLRTVVWIPSTKTKPLISAVVREETVTSDPLLHYAYRIGNRKDGIESIDYISLDCSDLTTSEVPDGWETSSTDMEENGGIRVAWWQTDSDDSGIRPGTALGGFEISSHDLPGVVGMRIQGATPGDWGFPDDGPNPNSPVGIQFDVLNSHDYLIKYSAAPKIVVPKPFDPIPVLEALNHHLGGDVLSAKLVSQTMAEKLSRVFEAAISAAKAGNQAGLRHQIGVLRSLIVGKQAQSRREQRENEIEVSDDEERENVRGEHFMAETARKVFNFDLAYLERRLMVGGASGGRR